MPIQDQLQSASYKGVPFLMRTSLGAGGRKTVIHEFVDSDVRFVQDLGLLNKTFTMVAVTNSQTYGYFSKRDALLNALDSPGPGELIHPFYGILYASATDYRIAEELNKLGEAVYEITFELDAPNQSPFAITNNLSAILDIANECVRLVNNGIALSYALRSGFPNNYADALNKVLDIGIYFNDISTRFNTVPAQMSELNVLITNYNTSAPFLTSQPTDLATSINGLFQQSNNVNLLPSQSLLYYQAFFNFGDDDIPLNVVTVEQQERQNNRNLLNASVQVSALALAYQNASLITYVTELDINDVRNLLESQYQKCSLNPAISRETMYSLENLRGQMRKFFKQQETIASKIITVQTKMIPAAVLAYQYYGNTDKTEEIIQLNKIQDVSFVEGSVQILTDNNL